MSTKKSDNRNDRDDCRDDDRDDDHNSGRIIRGTNGNDTLTGTSGNDSVYGGDGNDRINAGGGNDYVDGGKGNDSIDGGSGNDRLDGGSGSDTFTGGVGNDNIDGGSGLDVAIYSGKFSDYKLTLSRDGGHCGDDDDDRSAMTVHDKRSGSPDGVDVLKNVEVLRFSDGEYRDGRFYPSAGPTAKVTAILALSLDSGTITSDFITNQATQTVTGKYSGTLRASDVIQVSADGGVTWVNATVSGSTFSASGVTLAPGSGSLLTQTMDSAGHTLAGASHSYILDTLATAAVSAPIMVDGAINASEQANVTISGTTTSVESGRTLVVSVTDGVHTANGTATVGATGVWSATGLDLSSMNQGTLNLTVSGTDLAGNAAIASTTVIKDTIVAAPSLTATFVDSGVSDTDATTSTTTVKLSGTAEAGATVIVYDDVSQIGTALADASGVWRYNATLLANGTHNFAATQTDVAGNTSGASTSINMTVDTIAAAAPTFDLTYTDSGVPGDMITNAREATLMLGTAEPKATVMIYDGTTPIATVLANPVDGTWTFNATSLGDGTHSFTATQMDVAGNVSAHTPASAVTVDTAAAAPVVALASDTGTYTTDRITHVGTLTVTGTDADALVEYSSTDEAGSWATIAPVLAQGANRVYVRQTDVADNVSAATPFDFTFDDQVAAPTMALATDTGAVNGDNITRIGTLSTGGIESYATVEYSIDGGTTWAGSDPAVVEGPNSVQVRQIDVAGNVSNATTLDFSLDRFIATPTISGTVALDTYGTMYGTAEADSTVTARDGSIVLGTTIADGDGEWTFVFTSPPSSSPVYTVTAVDVAGNSSGTSNAYPSTTVGINTPPVLDPLPEVSFADTAVTNTFNTVTGQLTGHDPDAGATLIYEITDGVSSAAPSGYDLAKTGQYGILYVNSTSGVYAYVPDSARIDALPFGGDQIDEFTLTVSDGLDGTDDTPLTIRLTGANDAPVVLTASLITVDYSDTAAKNVFEAKTGLLSGHDPDIGATLTYGANEVPTATGTYGTVHVDSESGAYTFVPNSAAINALPAGANATEIFDLTVSDGMATAAQTLTISLTGANDASVISGVQLLNYTVGQPAVLVAPELTLADADNDHVTSATVVISGGYSPGNDVLSINPTTLLPGMTATYANNGVLTVTGSGSLLAYQQVLDSVTFSTTTAGGRTVGFTVFDGAVQSATVTTTGLSADYLGTTGFRIPGEPPSINDSGASGFSVNGAGDVNGDGYADLIIGAPFTDPNGAESGTSYVIYGKSSAFDPQVPLFESESSPIDGINGFKLTGAATNDSAGFAVSGAGDVNGDGFSDLIIGATYADPNGEESGASYVVFGSDTAFPMSVALSSLTGDNGFRIIGAAEGDRSGYAVSSAGDVNGDGFADLLIGATYASPNGTVQTGASYVVFGKASFSADLDQDFSLDLVSLDGSNGFRIAGLGDGDRAGDSVSKAGDVNGDGYGDLIIGATKASPGVFDSDGEYSGQVYVVFGGASGFDGEVVVSALNGTNGFRLSGAGAGARAGYAVSSAGDVNGDGFADVIIGAPYANTANGPATGAAYVIFGKESAVSAFSPNVNLSALGSDGFEISGAASDDRAGYAVSAAGDVNGDGYGDLIVGAPDAKLNDEPSGTTYIVFGKASGSNTNVDLFALGGNDGFQLSAVGPGDQSGYAVSAAGDVNGDGFDDVIVGSPHAAPGGVVDAGESYVIYGSKFIVGENTFLGRVDGGTLQGTAGNDRFIGGQGDDLMYGQGGVDSFRGGAGDDTVHLGAAGSSATEFLNIDGGSGVDTLALDGSGMVLDLTTLGLGDRVHNIEHIDLTGSGNNTLALDIRDLLNMSENSNTLQIDGNAGDVVNIKLDVGATPWADPQLIGGYQTYSEGMAQLLVDPAVTVHFI